MARYDDLNIRAIALAGVLSTILIVAMIVGLQALYFSQQASLSGSRPIDTSEAANLVAEQDARLRQTGWIDREAGTVAIPIDRAMRLVVQELRTEQGGSP